MTARSAETGSDGHDRSGAEYWDRRSRPSGTIAQGPLVAVLRTAYNRKFDHLVRGLLDRVPRNGGLLELGCAPGWFLARVHRLRPDIRLAGIDYAPQSVEHTCSFLAEIGLEADIEQADLRTFARAEPVDAVVSSGLVEHFDDPLQIVRHHARIAGNGASVLISVPNFRPWPVRRAFEWLSPQDFATHNLSVMTPAALERLCTDCGLVEVVSGYGGGATLYATPRERPRFPGRVYLVFARLWNLGAAVWPESMSPWHGYCWVAARVPDDY